MKYAEKTAATLGLKMGQSLLVCFAFCRNDLQMTQTLLWPPGGDPPDTGSLGRAVNRCWYHERRDSPASSWPSSSLSSSSSSRWCRPSRSAPWWTTPSWLFCAWLWTQGSTGYCVTQGLPAHVCKYALIVCCTSWHLMYTLIVHPGTKCTHLLYVVHPGT